MVDEIQCHRAADLMFECRRTESVFTEISPCVKTMRLFFSSKYHSGAKSSKITMKLTVIVWYLVENAIPNMLTFRKSEE